jgi:hypothetical protein
VCYNKKVITKHFFKILFLFIGLIIVGLLGVALVNSFSSGSGSSVSNNSAPVAK